MYALFSGRKKIRLGLVQKAGKPKRTTRELSFNVFIDCAPWHCMHNLICYKMPQAGVEPARRSLDMGF